MSPQEIEDQAQSHMEMVFASIREDFRKGEISYDEAMNRIYHEGMKSLQEQIKETEEEIEMRLLWGRPDSKDPKVIERQKTSMERQKKEDPAIIKCQEHIEILKQNIAELEEKLQHQKQ